MSEDDRAAKAARAKAMLKKRQREKAGPIPFPGSASPAAVDSPVVPSRTLSPQPYEPSKDEKRDLADVFNKSDPVDASWLSSLPRAATPPLPARDAVPTSKLLHLEPSAHTAELLAKKIDTLGSENALLGAEIKRLRSLEPKLKESQSLLEHHRSKARELEEQLQQLNIEKDTALQNERQTISLLVQEKSSLAVELERLENVNSKNSALEKDLEQERSNVKNLEERFLRLQTDEQISSKAARDSQIKEKEALERLREKERELQLAKSSASTLRQEAEQYQTRLRELEEQIQSDDRIERLEESLKNTQERADELEFQLTKLKQVHAILKVERDELGTRFAKSSESRSELETKYSELEALYTTTEQRLSSFLSEKDVLAQEKSGLQSRFDATQRALSEVQEQLAQTVTAMASNTRQLQTAQNEVKFATRRAAEAEKFQHDLQTEGTALMRSLDEMRPKIVELTDLKLELTERISDLELQLKRSNDTIFQLETRVQDEMERKDDLERQIRDFSADREKERKQALSTSSDLQKAYDDLQDELDSATASLKNLEAERSRHHQDTTRRLEEIDRLTSVSRARSEEVTRLRHELDAVVKARDEGQELLDSAQNDIETLEAELTARDSEIERLREVSSSPIKDDAPRSLDDELLSSIRQQHALELSAAHSQIRALETSVFDANAHSHALQKQINILESQLANSHSRPGSRLTQRPYSPGSIRSDTRRQSIGGTKVPSSLARSIFDQNMTLETRHKRLVSLSMLKARIDSELQVTVTRPSSRASSVRPLSPENDPQHTYHDHSYHHPYRPQFLDDSHVFWCHSCSGDLVIL